MGMYDSVWVKCPKCDTENEFQSKSGDCSLEHYTLENCPEDVLANVNRHSPCNCECGAIYSVDISIRKPILEGNAEETVKEQLTEQYVVNKLKELQGVFDTESNHILADQILCDLLTRLGYNKVVQEFKKIDKWYA